MNLLPENEIAVHSVEDAMKIAEVLTNDDNNYCVLISREEDLWIVNFIWARYANRNEVVFMSRDDYEEACFECDRYKAVEKLCNGESDEEDD